jgi:hypothetical protein
MISKALECVYIYKLMQRCKRAMRYLTLLALDHQSTPHVQFIPYVPVCTWHYTALAYQTLIIMWVSTKVQAFLIDFLDRINIEI